jgi:hypothetical protein
MTDYYPLIGKAVAGLEKNTGEARRQLYERARTALVGQLRNMNPPLAESEITRERLALEEAIRKVEAEAARRLRMEPPRPDALSNVRPGDAAAPEPAGRPPDPPAPARDAAPPPPRRDMPPPPRRESAAPPPPPRREGPPPPPRRDGSPPAPPRDESEMPPEPPRSGRNRMMGERPPLTEEGLRGFRDVVAEAENLGEKTAQATKSARQAYAAVPTDIPEFDRVEPRLDPAPPPRTPPPREAPGPRPLREAAPPRRPPEPPSRQAEAGHPSMPVPPMGEHESLERGHSRHGLVAVLLTLFVILGIGIAGYVMRDRIATLTGAMRGIDSQLQRDAAPARPKIPDRIGQDAQPASPRAGPPQTSPAQQPPLPAVAQRVVLIEEDPADPGGRRYTGSAIWRTETTPAGSGQGPELAVRCDVEIPDRRLAMTFSMRRNTDQALPASHTVEVMFNLPADFPFGGIGNVPGILMKQAEATRGAPLSGLAVKVTSGFFLLGLSSVETEKERNLQLLKERAWFDIPVVYNNGRRAIIAVEKGNPGERAFKDAFAAWGQ